MKTVSDLFPKCFSNKIKLIKEFEKWRKNQSKGLSKVIVSPDPLNVITWLTMKYKRDLRSFVKGNIKLLRKELTENLDSPIQLGPIEESKQASRFRLRGAIDCLNKMFEITRGEGKHEY